MIRGFNFSDRDPVELSGGGRFVVPRKDFVPAYVRTFEKGVLQQRATEAVDSLRSCRVCPRDCEIDRFNNRIGLCKSGRLARVASAFLHSERKIACAGGTDRARSYLASAISAACSVRISRRASSAKALKSMPQNSPVL